MFERQKIAFKRVIKIVRLMDEIKGLEIAMENQVAEYESLEREMFDLFMENINIKMQLRYFFRNQENMSPQDIVAARFVPGNYPLSPGEQQNKELSILKLY